MTEVEKGPGDNVCVKCGEWFCFNFDEGYSNVCDSCWAEYLAEAEDGR